MFLLTNSLAFAFTFNIVAFAVLAIGFVIEPNLTLLALSLPLAVVGTLVFVVGCAEALDEKGYDPLWSLLGLLNFVGGVIVLTLPARAQISARRGFEVEVKST